MPNAPPQASAPALPALKNFGPALMRLWPHGDSQVPGLRAGTIASAPAVFAKYHITSLFGGCACHGAVLGGVRLRHRNGRYQCALHSQ
jgi:hypothetical protein